PPPLVRHRAEHSAGLVQRQVQPVVPDVHPHAVDVDHVRRRVHPPAEDADDLAVDRYPPGGDEILSRPPGRHPRRCQHLLKADTSLWFKLRVRHLPRIPTQGEGEPETEAPPTTAGQASPGTGTWSGTAARPSPARCRTLRSARG